LLVACSAWMIGIGFRFIMMHEGEVYFNSPFDKIFDWGGLLLLGLLLFVWNAYDYFKEEGIKFSKTFKNEK